MAYDLIGDIHGHGRELHALLRHLGYGREHGCYRHPSRTAVFLGDFIDRGEDQRGVLETVMQMVSRGAALAVMGNHEFNALAFHTRHADGQDGWLRPRSDKNIGQHLAFLREALPDRAFLGRALDFFWSLPLWLELDGLRVVHACWDPSQIEFLRSRTGPGNRMTQDLLVKASTMGTPEHQAIETVLKGIEQNLPEGGHVVGNEQRRRRAVRIKWWEPHPQTLGTASFAPKLDAGQASLPVRRDKLIGYPPGSPPVFIGHYWLRGDPAPLADNLACLDYSVAKNGKLVAYRWDGEQVLDPWRFHHA